MNKIWLKWFSYSPIFVLTKDENFWEKKPNDEEYRFSIIQLAFGDEVFYFFSWLIVGKRYNFKWFHHLKLKDNASFKITKIKANELQNNYIAHLLTLSDENILNIEAYGLDMQLAIEQHRSDRNLEKIAIYATFTSILITAISLGGFRRLIESKFLISIVFYIFINALLLLKQSINMQSGMYQKFSDLKKIDGEAIDKLRVLVLHKYLNWQYAKRKSDFELSYSLKIQDWLVILVCILIGVVVVEFFSSFDISLDCYALVNKTFIFLVKLIKELGGNS